MTPGAAAWLRSAIVTRRETAEKATSGPWEDGGGYVTGVGGDVQVTDYGTQDGGSGDGTQGEADSAHIALNDPTDTLARCEGELQTLDHFEILQPNGRSSALDAFATAVRCVATGYKNWPGWDDHFGQG